MLIAPDSRKMVLARLRGLAMTRGAAAVRTWERSSPKSVPRTQCSRSPMPPVAADDGGELGVGGLGEGQRGDRVPGFAVPLPLQLAAAHDLDGLGSAGEASGHRGDRQGAPLGAAVPSFP